MTKEEARVLCGNLLNLDMFDYYKDEKAGIRFRRIPGGFLVWSEVEHFITLDSVKKDYDFFEQRAIIEEWREGKGH